MFSDGYRVHELVGEKMLLTSLWLETIGKK